MDPGDGSNPWFFGQPQAPPWDALRVLRYNHTIGSPMASCTTRSSRYNRCRTSTTSSMYSESRHYNNAYFAWVGGVELREMNGLELEFLFALQFCLNDTPDDFASYCTALEGEMMATTTPPPMSPPTVSVSPEQEEEDATTIAEGVITAFAAAARVSVVEITQ